MTDPISIPGKVIVFDYGEVISNEPTVAERSEIVALAGMQERASQFWNSYWLHRFALDHGTVTPKEYWRRIEHDLEATWHPAQHHELWLRDFRSWLAIDPNTLDVLLDLQRGNTRMALLSNAGRDFASYYRHGMLGDFFEVVLISGEIGSSKPSRAIYEHLLRELSAPAKDVVFIDNRTDNVAGAEAVGIAGHVYTTTADLRLFLSRLTQP
ncbi:HAD family hydrolase [Microbacterium forte]|uniref:HAD family hydrolase n=1 Tax=Microbacterium forte TaxID=2982533 RepID=UPI002892F9E2|nr:HAD family phosphatase [Microbacterium sp. A(2022)]